MCGECRRSGARRNNQLFAGIFDARRHNARRAAFALPCDPSNWRMDQYAIHMDAAGSMASSGSSADPFAARRSVS
jgi:hypothetical protein